MSKKHKFEVHAKMRGTGRWVVIYSTLDEDAAYT